MNSRKIKDFINEVKDYYIVYEDGKVYSTISNKFLKPSEQNGYLRYGLMLETGKLKNFFAHRLVGLAFLKQIENKEYINHMDGNKLNNNINNLEWCTASENMQHADKNGLRQIAKGEKVHGSKLIRNDIDKIFKLRKEGLTQQEIANIFNVNRSTIGYVLRGKTWKK